MKATTLNWRRRGLALVLISLAIALGASAADRPGRGSYAAFDLGTLGGVRSEGYDINAIGDVAGYSYTSGVGSYGFVWRNGMMQKLGAFPGGHGSVAYGLNADGVAVGFADGSDTRIIYYTNVNTGEIFSSTVVSNYFLPCRWSGGALEALDTLLPNDGGHARAINSFGQIAGDTGWSFPDQNNTNIIRLVNRAVRWSAGGVEDLRPGPWSYSLAYGINDLGDAVGSAVRDVHIGGPVHAMLFGAMGGAQDLHTITSPANSIAYGVNIAGQVVGAAYNVPTHIYDQPFIWTAEGMRLLRTPFGDPYGQALDINDSGVAVGFLSGFATMWLDAGTTNESLVILQDLLASSTPLRLQIATAINNAGEITGYTAGPYSHAYLLYPTNSRHRIDGSAEVIGVDLTGLVVTNIIADAAIELFAVRGGALVSRQTGWTDANGKFSFLMRAFVDTEYALKIQLDDRDSLVAVHDAGRDSNNVAWLRTPVFTVDRDTRADLVMTINTNTSDMNHNETAYFLNGAGFSPTLVAPPADGAPGPATDTGAERFAHLAVIYRNTRIAARFAVDRLGLAMPLVPVYAFMPGTWDSWGPLETNGSGQVFQRASYHPTAYFDPTGGGFIVFGDIFSAYNEPFVGISATNLQGHSTRFNFIIPAGPGIPRLAGRNQPDNREFHEYGHAIMFASSIAGPSRLPARYWEYDSNHNNVLDPAEDLNGNGFVDQDQNHFGLENSNSSDSWVEGWAEFISAVISDTMLDRREKPNPASYRVGGAVENLDADLSLTNLILNNRLGSEERVINGLLWDIYDGTTAGEVETLQWPLDLYWQTLTANGPALETFHDVVNTLLGYSFNHSFVLPPAGLVARIASADVYDDASDPATAGNGQLDAGEILGATSWISRFPHRNGAELPEGSCLELTVTDAAGAVLSDVLFDIAIECDPPFEDRNVRYTFSASGAGPYGVPIILPLQPSRARIKARKPGVGTSGEWVVTSATYWAGPTGSSGRLAEPYFDRHTFVLGIPGGDLAIKLHGTGWEAAPATPPWALGNVAPQNGWVNAGNITGHQIVSNGSAGAVISGQAVTTPYGNQFHKFVASSSTTTASFRTVWPDLTAALAALPAGRKVFKASIDVFVPAVQDGVAGAYGIIAFHGAAAPWGVLVDPSDHSVNLFLDGGIRAFAVDSFELDTWFNLAVTANYTTAQISVDVNGVTLPSLTRTSTGIGLGALTDVDLVAWNYDPSAPPLRAAFSDNFRVSAQNDAEAFPVLSIAPAPAGAWKLCWSAEFRDWIVESTQNLGSGLWRTEPVVPTVVGEAACATLPAAPPRTFFRLRKP